MELSEPVDGFRIAYDRVGSGPPVVLVHGWPGDRTDYRELVPRLSGGCELLVPDLRGFGASDKHPADPAEQYGAVAQARSVAALIEEVGMVRPVVAGYDVGSRVAQALARQRPDSVRALVVAPPLPGIGRRILDPEPQQEFWYQAFHRLELIEALIDGRPEAVRAYLRHFWSHWSGSAFTVDEADLDHLVDVYGAPGAFAASIAWYRAGAGAVATSVRETTPAAEDRISVPTTVLWPDQDPLFPRAWSDRLDDYFSDATLRFVDGAGHFAPLEYPDEFAAAIFAALGM
ncbi:pimeloyl-ACP methyl ester carboxylesterase [Catenulispora sp. EB89]|uniref:alpha/beta fold hydrolase n=1 Tax=Catenulispora sp. EB89 TaxID=3156257 RepID=UPI003517E1E7